jgi:hypothetical protein
MTDGALLVCVDVADAVLHVDIADAALLYA